jgi:ribonuclease-3
MSPLDHDFADERWLELALTHASTGREEDNERLEFLGDTVLDLVVAEALFHRHPELDEGALTEFKAEVVSRRALAEAARRLDLEGHLQVGSGLRGRALPRSVLANVFEALVGALYLDAGLAACRDWILETLAEPLARPRHEAAPSNPKQELQQLAQRLWGAPPTYRTTEEFGRSHARAFRVVAVAGGREFPGAWGRTLKEAERWAAHEALLVLEDEGEVA